MTVARGGKRGKTAGRGGKGQSARAGNKRRPEWRDIIKRLPKLRGRGKNSNKSIQDRMVVINLSILESIFSANDSITPTVLVEKGVVSAVSGFIPSVKILGEGEVTKVFKISGCHVSSSAKEKIEKAGGSIVELSPAKPAAVEDKKSIKEASDSKSPVKKDKKAVTDSVKKEPSAKKKVEGKKKEDKSEKNNNTDR